MQEKWLSYQSFQQGQDILADINTVLINTKLNTDASAPEDYQDFQEARADVLVFLHQLEHVIDTLEQNKPVLGSDVRLKPLASHFVSGAGRTSREHTLPSPISLIRHLEAEESSNKDVLIEELTELRRVIEQHVQADALQVLGEF